MDWALNRTCVFIKKIKTIKKNQASEFFIKIKKIRSKIDQKSPGFPFAQVSAQFNWAYNPGCLEEFFLPRLTVY